MESNIDNGEADVTRSLARIETRHLRAGLWGLAIFVVLGLVLEGLHAIKAPFYLDAGQETTRLLLRLSHAHGTLVSLVNVVYALVVRARPAAASPVGSACLSASLVLLPAGFLLGGLFAHGGDPGLGVLLVPPGALALAAGIAVTARRV
ncbi:hypothetical protein AKJ09_05594 [Labilithrix luteola]|uniref:Uncharacterized protein n=1 Tax=Labilithrix luteola TaxID=1391654 RepID=A0A0K1PZG8_9BACT|nr:hypothetical protein [Labilithrix luteola]AKU98930.1 hypothetical protein AKJ09_05594 [Labilithrix luteola]